MKQAIILCSGGLDSVVCANYVKKKMNYGKMSVLFFDYGQKSLLLERKCAMKCAKKIGAEFKEFELNELANLSFSLVNSREQAKKLKREDLKDTKKESEKWYVPFRNTIFLVYALAFAEAEYLKRKIKSDIFVGFKCEGNESYPDTTQEYVNEMNKLARLHGNNLKIFAPLIKMDKEDIIQLGMKLGVDFKDTISCYAAKREHCGTCLACMLRKEGFYWSGIKDPTKYKHS